MPEKHTTMLILLRGNEVMLEKRPPSGIWGGLWCFPEVVSADDYVATTLKRIGVAVHIKQTLPTLSHAFTHFKLHIKPQLLEVTNHSLSVLEPSQTWLSIEDAMDAAIPTPVRKILQSLNLA